MENAVRTVDQMRDEFLALMLAEHGVSDVTVLTLVDWEYEADSAREYAAELLADPAASPALVTEVALYAGWLRAQIVAVFPPVPGS